MTPKKIVSSIQKASKSQINRAGDVISKKEIDFSTDAYQAAYDIISDWRALHTYPLNTFQANLRNKIIGLGLPQNKYIISQRLKRIASIIAKLQRSPQSQLSRFQDIGGIRAILPDMKSVILLQDIYTKQKSTSYTLIRQKDYISDPKDDGYRSIHMVFEYTNSRYPQTAGLNFEFQIRTFLQHAWATAVETIGTFIGQPLKSNQGPQEWLDYFRWVSVGFAYLEGTKINDQFINTSPFDLVKSIAAQTKALQVEQKIKGFSVALKLINEQLKKLKKSAKLFLIILNTKKRRVLVDAFSNDQKETAIKRYKTAEKESLQDTTKVVVLVSIDQINNLQKAYPSFFGDNALFLQYLQELESTYL